MHGADYENAAAKVIRVLLNVGKERGFSEEDEENDLTAMHVALQQQGEEAYIIESFLRCGIKLGEDALDMALCGCAANELNASKVQKILDQCEGQEFDWATILRLAIDNGALEAMKILVQHKGAHILTVKDENSQTPLHWAARGAKLSIVKYLMSQSLPADLEDEDGVTPIGSALLSKSVQVVEELLNAHPRLLVLGGRYKGASILMHAVSSQPGTLSMMKLLLSDEDQCGPRFQCLRQKEVLNSQDEVEGNTVLHRSVMSGDSDAVQALLMAGADSQTRNLRNQTALELGEEIVSNLTVDSNEVLYDELSTAIELLRQFC